MYPRQHLGVPQAAPGVYLRQHQGVPQAAPGCTPGSHGITPIITPITTPIITPGTMGVIVGVVPWLHLLCLQYAPFYDHLKDSGRVSGMKELCFICSPTQRRPGPLPAISKTLLWQPHLPNFFPWAVYQNICEQICYQTSY